MIPFYWYDILIIPGIAQGLFLAAYLKFQKTNKSANNMLAWLLIMATFMLVGRLIWFRYPAGWPLQFALVGDAPIFLFGPIFWAYVKRLLFNPDQKDRLRFIHFIPVVLHVIFLIFSLFISKEAYINSLYTNGTVRWYLFALEGAAIALNLGYLRAVYLYVMAYKRRSKQLVAHEQSAIKFLRYFQLAILVCLIIWFGSFVSNSIIGLVLPFGYDAVWIIMSAIIYLVGYFGLKDAGLMRVPIVEVKDEKSHRLDLMSIQAFTKQLETLLEVDKVYEDNQLTLGKLSELVGTSSNNVSWLINEIHGKNFYDYINHYRINAFVSKVYNREHELKTILALANEVGFNAKSTFNKAFRDEMNDTPSNFITRLTAASNKSLMVSVK